MADDPNATTAPPSGTAAAAAGNDLADALSGAQSAVDEMQQAMADAGVDLEAPSEESDAAIGLLGDVDLDVTIELGRTEMLVEDVLRLASGSVVELDKLAGDPVDVKVNGRLVARGEVLVLNDNFCIRISEIVADLDEQAQAAAELAVAEAGG
ncbi:MAG: flagellar motor switch protein FliN [Planctomycetota bacterium]